MRNFDFKTMLSVFRKVAMMLVLIFVGTAISTTDTDAAENSFLQEKLVSANFNNVALEEALLFIKNESGYFLLYNSETVRNTEAVTVHCTNAPVRQVMREVLKDTDLDFSIADETIIIRAKSENPQPPQSGVTIRGKVVTATNKQPIQGAVVSVKGTSSGTTTDANGEFVLKLDSAPTAPLSVSFLGMQAIEITYTGQQTIVAELKEKVESIDEVVVSTGYQQVNRRILTSSIASVSGDEVKMSNALTLDNMLQGRIAGMMVMNSTSTPGASTSIRVRGTSTISGNHEPLWVIDGIIHNDPVPISTEELNSLDNVNLIANAISGLNPMDIERIDVLKDASATAIYGARSANGVIVITTKKGRKGDPQVNYSGTFSVTERADYGGLNRMNATERIDVSREIEEKGLAYRYRPAAVGYEGLLYDLYDRKIDYAQFLNKVTDLEKTNTDWFDILMRTAFTHKHNVSVSGASDKINYYFSGAYTNDQSNVKGTGVEQYNAMMKLSANLRHNLFLNIKTSGAIIKKNYLHTNLDAYGYAYNTSRAIPAYDADGGYAYYAASQGHDQQLKRSILNDIDNSGRQVDLQTMNFMAKLDWNIISGLKASGTLGIASSSTAEKKWFGEKSWMATELRNLNYGEELPTSDAFVNQTKLPYGGELMNENMRHFNYTLRAQVDYNNYFNGDHVINLSVGGEALSTKYDGIRTTQWGYLPDRGEKFTKIIPSEWPQYQTMMLNTPNVVTNRLTHFVSFYGIATYAFRSRYIFNANIRADGSNKFGQDKSARFLPIWSVSARWNLHNESLLKDVMWLNELSVRGSYGLQGNVSDDQTPNLLANIGPMDPTSGEYYNTLYKLPNPFLKWEKTKSYNAALDFALFDNRLTGTIEYYYKKGVDQIVSIPVSLTTGVPNLTTNVGDVVNKGYEMIISVVPVRTDDFTWVLNLNGGKNINNITRGGMVTQYGYADYMNGRVILAGNSINSFFSYQFDKLDSNGLPTFKGIEETDGMTPAEMFAQAFKKSGNRLPDIQGGAGTTLRYKNLTLNLFFSYSLGSKIRLNNLYSNSGQYLTSPQQNMSKEFVDRWRKPGDEAWAVIPALSTESLSMGTGVSGRKIAIAGNMWQMYNQSDLRVVSGDFLRLRTASLNYVVPKDICAKIGIKAASVKVEGNNLWLIASKKLNGQDPEQVSFGSLFGGTTPPVSTFSLGLNISF